MLLIALDETADWKSPLEADCRAGIQDVSIVADHMMLAAWDNESTKFRVFYKTASGWKAIGDFNKNNVGNRIAIMTLNVPIYRVNGKARFTVRSINSKGQ